MTTAAEGSRDNEGLVAFLQALALTILGIDDFPPRQRTADGFMRVLDGLLGEIPSMTEREGAGQIHESTQLLRRNLEVALQQARRVKSRTAVNAIIEGGTKSSTPNDN